MLLPTSNLHPRPDTKPMTPKFDTENIIDLAALDQQIGTLHTGSDPLSESERTQLLPILRNAMTKGREQLHRYHLEGASGEFIVLGHTHLTDAILQRIHALILAGHEATESFCLAATGGYGRKDLAPYSDIDLLFIIPDGHTNQQALVERMLYILWDIGMDVGHAVRTVDECLQQARQELQILTSMLESRFLAGNHSLFTHYQTTLFDHALLNDPLSFLRGKLLEQSKRHERFGASLYYLEPNIKENPGGLRDLHTFAWISKYRYHVKRTEDLIGMGIITQKEFINFKSCRSFLRRVRNALHYRTGRRDDRLTFGHQVAIAQEFGYQDKPGMLAVERFMRTYYRVARRVGNLSWIFLRKYQDEHKEVLVTDRHHLEDIFEVINGKLAVSSPDAFLQNPIRIMSLFEIAQRNLLSIHPDTMRLLNQNLSLINQEFRSNSRITAIFLNMLNGKRAVAWVLRRMNDAGVLGRYIPEFGRIIGQTQHDMYHVFTVDEHTILAVEALRAISTGKLAQELPISTQLMQKLNKPALLYLAVLFHDIAKGLGSNHQIRGAEIAKKICERMDLPSNDIEMIVWLVENHLIFSRTAFRRDINDPETLAYFTKQIGTVRKLNLLVLLTVADIRAVGPGVWNQWKGNLLRQLYEHSLDTLHKGIIFTPDEIAQRSKVQKEATFKTLSKEHDPELVQRHLDRFYPDYFMHFAPEMQADHFVSLKSIEDQPLVILFKQVPKINATRLLVYTPDHPGLMARISGSLAAAGANILSADITTTKDGMALDTFIIQTQNGEPIESPSRQERIISIMTQVLEGKLRPSTLLATSSDTTRRKFFEISFSMEVDESLDTFTVIEITSLDRPGLLFAITNVLQAQDIQIRAAKIATYGERVVDVFYLRDIFGLKLNARKLELVSRKLQQAVDKLE
ncbi:MAG: [protein-PII] uridylyltransferase [Magnetococcales bacterium]|nr:[protein-PII] uridylyltransferase [Magnetococcales bacterium]